MKTVRKKVTTLFLALLGLSLLTNCSNTTRSHIGAGLGGATTTAVCAEAGITDP